MAGPKYGRLRYDLTKVGLGMQDGDFIKLGVVGTDDLVILIDNVADTDASGYAPGSLCLDTTDGLLFVADSSGNWQEVTV